ncbi:Coenzyme A biosynthesis protein 3, partial [Lachnellula arida]
MLQMNHPEHNDHHTQTPNPPPPFTASSHAADGKKHLLLAASGSVATIKIPAILRALSTHANLSIILILTKAATNFLAGSRQNSR